MNASISDSYHNQIEPFLGVAESMQGRFWQERCSPGQSMIALAIAQTHGLPDILAKVLAGRGVSVADAPSFLEPRLRDLLPNPSILRDMDKAAVLLANAIKDRRTIAVFGDYDVDGACSAALLCSYLEKAGCPYLIHIPDRQTEGYGPNKEAIRALAQEGAQVLVTVDCGITSHEPLQEAADLGLDAIVLDHHQAPQQLPKAHALVNPNRQDDVSGLGHLCAAGVVYLALIAVHRVLRSEGFWAARGDEPDLLADLDLVALATVADVVPLMGLNRAFVRQGLTIIRQRMRLGLAALLDVSGLKNAPEAWHLGFLVGPRINAGGRIGDASLGAKLLMTGDPVHAAQLASELDRLNRERQVIESEAVAQAEVQAERLLAENGERSVIVTKSDAWHPGVVGLIASRLKERFRRPAFAFAVNGEQATGSGRSIPHVDLGKSVRAAQDAGLIIKGGGHAMAAGATVDSEGLAAFEDFLETCLMQESQLARRADVLQIDASLHAAGLQPSLIKILERAGPYGSGQPDPVFVLQRHRLMEVHEVGAGGHLRVKLKSGDGHMIGGIAFRAASQPFGQRLIGAHGQLLHAAGTVSLDQWNGQQKVSFKLVDAALA